MQVKEPVFDPVKYSIPECEFLLAHIGESPVVALQGGVPTGCVLKSIQEALVQVYDLVELEKHSRLEWVGLDRVKDSLRAYVRETNKWAEQKARNPRAPRFPSMYSFDARGRGYLGGPGSDSGRVKTYFDEQGNRVEFAVNLFGDVESEWKPEWASATVEKPAEKSYLVVDAQSHRIECRVPFNDGTVCGHTEAFKEGSRASYNAARARMSKHLRAATTEVEAHRETHTNEFASGGVK